MRAEGFCEFTCEAFLFRGSGLLVEIPQNTSKVEARRGKNVLISDQVEHRQVCRLQDRGDDGRNEGGGWYGDYLHVLGMKLLYFVWGFLDDDFAKSFSTRICHYQWCLTRH